MTLPAVGIHEVRHPDRPTPFRLSVMLDRFGCLTGVAGFEHGQPVPKRGRHLLLTDSVHCWIEELQSA